jgi:hypothetical protein
MPSIGLLAGQIFIEILPKQDRVNQYKNYYSAIIRLITPNLSLRQHQTHPLIANRENRYNFLSTLSNLPQSAV